MVTENFIIEPTGDQSGNFCILNINSNGQQKFDTTFIPAQRNNQIVFTLGTITPHIITQFYEPLRVVYLKEVD